MLNVLQTSHPLTGAGTGIGRACALAFAREGASLALIDAAEKNLRRWRKNAARSLVISADFARKAEINRGGSRTPSPVSAASDVLVTTRASMIPGTASRSRKQWDQIFQVNVKSLGSLSCAVLPHFRKSGRRDHQRGFCIGHPTAPQSWLRMRLRKGRSCF